MSPPLFVFHRPELATHLADGLAGAGLGDFRSGLFLAAPRRTGKSTFLKADLLPECEKRKWLPLYVDLWADRSTDPGLLIAKVIAAALIPFESRVRKLLKNTGADKFSLLRTISWDFTRSALPEGATLTEALQLLIEASGKLVVLAIDEAQHALVSEKGISAMFALKSARDTLNADHPAAGLRLVFTGSSRDKLAQLILKKNQPFFGSRVTAFPLLGRDFTKAFTAHINANLRSGNRFQAGDVYEAFEMLGHRPELLRALVGEVALEMGAAKDLGSLLHQGAMNHRDGIWSEFENAYRALTSVQQSVLRVMAEKVVSGHPFTPFAEETLASIRECLAEQGSGDEMRPLTTATVQSAIEALREKELIWKPERGGYAFEDGAMAEWFANQARR